MQLSQHLLSLLLLHISLIATAASFGTIYESLVCCNQPIRKRAEPRAVPRALYRAGARNGYSGTRGYGGIRGDPSGARADALRTLLQQAEVKLATRDDHRLATDSVPRDSYNPEKSIIDYIVDMIPREVDDLIRVLDLEIAPLEDSYYGQPLPGALSPLVPLQRRAEHASERSSQNSNDIFLHSLLPSQSDIDLRKDKLQADLLALLNYNISPQDILTLVDKELESRGIRPNSYATRDLSPRDLSTLNLSLRDLSSRDLLPPRLFSVSRRQIGHQRSRRGPFFLTPGQTPGG